MSKKAASSDSRVRVIRIIEYFGPEADIDRTIKRSLKDGAHHFGHPDFTVRVVTIEQFEHHTAVKQILKEISIPAPFTEDKDQFKP